VRTEKGHSDSEAHGSVFATTHWSVVLAAAGQDSPAAATALEQLCRSYWYPLYVYVRRRGNGPEDAQDLTQAFFAYLLEKQCLGRADPARGRFRTFLLHALENFLANEWRREHRLKRGAGVKCLSLDSAQAEPRYTREPAVTMTPERAYARRWALTVLNQVLTDLQQEYARTGHSRVFDELAELLWGKDPSLSYARIAERLGMTANAVYTAMHRLRERYRDRLHGELARTVADVREVDDERRYLMAVLTEDE
jgi:RNA polymerase sigma factor (sigma-70 family)